MRKSRNPTKKRASKAAPTCTWSVPPAAFVIAAVMVRPGSVGRHVNGPEPSRPPAIVATKVSPIARDVVMINAATMPETAAGITTRTTVFDFFAPTPTLASRSEFGTELGGRLRTPTP